MGQAIESLSLANRVFENDYLLPQAHVERPIEAAPVKKGDARGEAY